jgi:hypothetical protein
MYALNAVDAFHISESKDTYVYDIVPLAAGLAAISSDDSLWLLDPLTLSGAPINSIRRVNTEVTCLKAINNTTERGALLVCTAGRDGRVCLLDPRTAAKIGEVRTGELGYFNICNILDSFFLVFSCFPEVCRLVIQGGRGPKFLIYYPGYGNQVLNKGMLTFL